MIAEMSNPLTEYQWTTQPAAQRLVDRIVSEFLDRCTTAREMAGRMKEETGTRFGDWIETIFLPDSGSIRQELNLAGYVKYRDRTAEYERVFAQPKGVFPRISLQGGTATAVHLKVIDVLDFVRAWNLKEKIEGDDRGPYRRVRAFKEGDCELWAAERWGWTGYDLPRSDPARAHAVEETLRSFRQRRRFWGDDEAEGFALAIKLIDAAPLNTDFKCALFFQAEREYWELTNHAARVQKERQDRLGLGWGNHDHHTYRSSREHFARLVAVWEKLGFHCRERFYAGKEAGWGAQVMEQPYTGIITFNDVDLSPEELMGDFSHDGLVPKQALGTVGLWCGLHGEAFLQAGMHHLEAQFDFKSLHTQLESKGVKMMKPFTNFPHLTQAFTEGQRWPVRADRLERLLRKGQITEQQATDFRKHGAIGSHLENLERNEGFKGFNQTGVSEIISATDPRKQHAVKSA